MQKNYSRADRLMSLTLGTPPAVISYAHTEINTTCVTSHCHTTHIGVFGQKSRSSTPCVHVKNALSLSVHSACTPGVAACAHSHPALHRWPCMLVLRARLSAPSWARLCMCM
jgi:hypothetical protein